MNNKQEIYISVDVEADGPCPPLHSMLSFGAAAFAIDGSMLDTLERNLELLPNASPHHDTSEFWARFPNMYQETRKNTVSPETAMKDLLHFVNNLKSSGKPVFMAYPARYDLRLIDTYSWMFLNQQMLGLGCIDLKSVAFTILKCDFNSASKRNMPKRWFKGTGTHTHKGIDDAIEQGKLGVNMIRESRGLSSLK